MAASGAADAVSKVKLKSGELSFEMFKDGTFERGPARVVDGRPPRFPPGRKALRGSEYRWRCAPHKSTRPNSARAASQTAIARRRWFPAAAARLLD